MLQSSSVNSESIFQLICCLCQGLFILWGLSIGSGCSLLLPFWRCQLNGWNYPHIAYFVSFITFSCALVTNDWWEHKSDSIHHLRWIEPIFFWRVWLSWGKYCCHLTTSDTYILITVLNRTVYNSWKINKECTGDHGY